MVSSVILRAKSLRGKVLSTGEEFHLKLLLFNSRSSLIPLLNCMTLSDSITKGEDRGRSRVVSTVIQSYTCVVTVKRFLAIIV